MSRVFLAGLSYTGSQIVDVPYRGSGMRRRASCGPLPIPREVWPYYRPLAATFSGYTANRFAVSRLPLDYAPVMHIGAAILDF